MRSRISQHFLAVIGLTLLSATIAAAQSQHEHAGTHAKPQQTNAANAPYDLQFIDTLSKHHQDAIEMSRMAVRKARHRELKMLAQKMIRDQQGDIAKMKGWRGRWYPGRPKAVNMEMPGMSSSMNMDMGRLRTATGNAFDIAFIDMMTAHHQSGIEMARDALGKSEHAEIKSLAQKNLENQQKESEQMNSWKSAWGSGH